MHDTTTEPVTTPVNNPITAQDLRALRHADSIVFRLYQGQASIEANRDARHTSTGFDEKHTIYVGGANVTDYGREHTYVPQGEQHRYSGFEMAHSGIYNAEIRTLVNRMRVGCTVNLAWYRDNNTDTVRAANLHVDELKLLIYPPTKDDKQVQPEVYSVETRITPDNSARMVKLDWNGV